MTQFDLNDDGGTKDLVSKRDVILEADSDQDGVGDIILRTGGVERARINHAGVGTGWASVLSGSISYVAAPTNVAATDNAAVAAANIAGGWLYFLPGTYKLTQGFTIDPTVSCWVLHPKTILDFSGLVSGSAITISSAAQMRAGFPVIVGGVILGPTSGPDGITLGGSGAFANGVRIADCEIQNFVNQIVFNSNTWATLVENVGLNAGQTSAVNIASGTNMGERLVFVGVDIYNGPQEGVIHTNVGSDSFWSGCSFDYQGRAINMTGGVMVCDGCHFEGADVRVATSASEYILVTDQTTQPKLRLNSCRFVSAFTTRPRWITSPTTKREAVTITDPDIHA